MIRFLAKRRLNCVDGVSASACAAALTRNEFWAAGFIILVGALISVFVEDRAARVQP